MTDKEPELCKAYAVERVIWDGGTGSDKTVCITTDLDDAVIIKEALAQVYPKRMGVESDKIISQRVEVEVHPLFRAALQRYVLEALPYKTQDLVRKADEAERKQPKP